MKYYIGKTGPHILLAGGRLIQDGIGNSVSESEFWSRMKEVLGDKFNEKEEAIRHQLSLSDNYIQFGDLKFSVL
jgi:hypothetical protein